MSACLLPSTIPLTKRLSRVFLVLACLLPLFLLACGNGSSVWPSTNPFNHNGSANPLNHHGQESPTNHSGNNNDLNHSGEANNPMSYGAYGKKGATEAGPLRWHLCNCLVVPSEGLIIPRRTYSVCATNPINAETYSTSKCRPLLPSWQRCSACVCTPVFACSTLGASL